ncbi:ROK family protein [Simiduia sp. 21SJ11W-1]|uniref:ROK family protein n=1 Tax=Simiduia sp. 21SJ11W-1 TaxID=2909669 RepID=UPI00209F9D30|nr:ROK family protein [Simiduia sp. 21SJ11W-1]UTA48297.1 ROK family protein [Simiduia sp. 21SJ11W-1]
MASDRMFIAADIGGTKIRAGVFDANLTLLQSVQRPSNATSGREALLVALAAAIDAVIEPFANKNFAGIGISTAGVVNAKTGDIEDATEAIPGWRNTRLGGLLAARYKVPVVVENDVKAALLGELHAAPALCAGRVVMLTLGTGLGGALAERGQIVAGARHLAGHFGRMPMPNPWHFGQWLTLEALVSGTGLARVANESAVGDVRETFANGHAVLDAVQAGNTQAARGLNLFCDYLAMALQQIGWSLDPDHIVLGGGLTEARSLWWHLLEARLAEAGQPLPVVAATLNNDAGMVGAATLIRDRLNAPQKDAHDVK